MNYFVINPVLQVALSNKATESTIPDIKREAAQRLNSLPEGEAFDPDRLCRELLRAIGPLVSVKVESPGRVVQVEPGQKVHCQSVEVLRLEDLPGGLSVEQQGKALDCIADLRGAVERFMDASNSTEATITLRYQDKTIRVVIGVVVEETAAEVAPAPAQSALEATPWAKRFKEQEPTAYRRALELASRDVVEVAVGQSDELGEMMWVVSSIEEPDFWLDTFGTQMEALALCKTMGWVVNNE